MKRINEQKLQAFHLGSMGIRTLSRKEIEDQKKREEEQRAANVFKEFIETFQEAPDPTSKVWVKAGTSDSCSKKDEDQDRGKLKLYKPESRLAREKAKKSNISHEDHRPVEDHRSLEDQRSREDRRSHEDRRSLEDRRSHEDSRSHEDRRSRVDRRSHEDRRSHKDRRTLEDRRDRGDRTSHDNNRPREDSKSREDRHNSADRVNRSPVRKPKLPPRRRKKKKKKKESMLEKLPLFFDKELLALRTKMRRQFNDAYVSGEWDEYKVTRSLYTKSKNKAKRQHLLSTDPRHSDHSDEDMLDHQSETLFHNKLPFNAQPINPEEMEFLPDANYKAYYENPELRQIMEEILERSVVKVVVPTELEVLAIIHRMIAFVIKEGPLFEALVMNHELENPLFQFLFDNESSNHVYYRWKLYSILQGDTITQWSEKPFRMFHNGPIWIPPAPRINPDQQVDECLKETLSTAQRDRFENLIRLLTPERSKIAEAMIFCIDHARAAKEISECIAQSLSNPDTGLSRKVARFYLIADILHNSSVNDTHASLLKQEITKRLENIVENLKVCLDTIESRSNSELFKTKIQHVFLALEKFAVFPEDFLQNLRDIFSEEQRDEELDLVDAAPSPVDVEDDDADDDDDDDDLEDVPLDGNALLRNAMLRMISKKAPEIPRATGIDGLSNHRNIENNR